MTTCLGVGERFAAEKCNDVTPAPAEVVQRCNNHGKICPKSTPGKSFGLRHCNFVNEASQFPGPGAYSDHNPVHKPVGYYPRNR